MRPLRGKHKKKKQYLPLNCCGVEVWSYRKRKLAIFLFLFLSFYFACCVDCLHLRIQYDPVYSLYQVLFKRFTEQLTSISLCWNQEYKHYCKNRLSKDVPWSDKSEFVNGWYILIIVSDTLTIIGSVLKIEIQTKVINFSSVTEVEPCSFSKIKIYITMISVPFF